METTYEKILIDAVEKINDEATKEASAHAKRFAKYIGLSESKIESLYEDFLENGEPWGSL